MTPPSNYAAASNAQASLIIAGVADYKVSRDPNAHIITYALGSCLGITFHDERRQIGGLLHVMLPDSRLHNRQDIRKPMFVDTGVPLIIDELVKAGANRKDLKCKVFGGAQLMAADHYFRIGAKNIDAFYEISRQQEINVTVWEVSGRCNRTIRLINSTGEVLVKTPAQPEFIR